MVAKFSRVVNIAVLVSLPTLSAILFEYCHDYRRYFSSIVSKWVSAILFQLFLAILDTNTFVSKQRHCGCCTTTPEAQHLLSARMQAVRPQYTLQGDIGRTLHATDTHAGVRLLCGWKNRCQDSHIRLRNVWFETRPRATYSPAGTPCSCSAGDSPPPPHST